MVWRGTFEYPPSSPELIHVNFFVWVFRKYKDYSSKPETMAKMRAVIEKECAQIPEEMLLDVSRSIFSKHKKRNEQNDQFEHLCTLIIV